MQHATKTQQAGHSQSRRKTAQFDHHASRGVQVSHGSATDTWNIGLTSDTNPLHIAELLLLNELACSYSRPPLRPSPLVFENLSCNSSSIAIASGGDDSTSSPVFKSAINSESVIGSANCFATSCFLRTGFRPLPQSNWWPSTSHHSLIVCGNCFRTPEA